MGSRFELAIFDCDGVLVDSEPVACRIDAEMATELGWPMTPQDVLERFVGRSESYLLDTIEEKLGDSLPADWRRWWRENFRAALARELTPVPGVAEALDDIGCATCVASSGTHEKMRFTLGLTGLHERFEGRIYSREDVERGKPEPDLFLHAAASMGFAPEACAVIEDSRYGVEAARSAGMHAFGFAGGLTPADWLEGPGTTVFTQMAELPHLLADRESS
jgi:HAD superfamily hydrolase (TIGR01509 family)